MLSPSAMKKTCTRTHMYIGSSILNPPMKQTTTSTNLLTSSNVTNSSSSNSSSYNSMLHSYNATLQRQLQRQQRQRRQRERTLVKVRQLVCKHKRIVRQLVVLCGVIVAVFGFLVTAIVRSSGRSGRGRTSAATTTEAASVETKNRNNHLSPAAIVAASRETIKSSTMQTLRQATPEPRIAIEQQTREVIQQQQQEQRQEQNIATDAFPDNLPRWLAEYSAFHRDSLLAMQRGMRARVGSTATTQSQDEANTPYLQYICKRGSGCGGLGDRINGMVQTFLTAVCTHRVFFIDAPDLLPYLQPTPLFNWDAGSGKGLMATIPESYQRYNLLDDRNHTFLVEPNTMPTDVTAIDVRANLWMDRVFFESACWKDFADQYRGDESPNAERDEDLDRDRVYRTAYTALFQWTPAVTQAVAALREHARLHSPYIAMHVRTGGLLSKNQNPLHPDPPRHTDPDEWRQFLVCARKLQRALQCNNNDAVDLYLAADHRSVKDHLIATDSSIKTALDLNILHLDAKRTDGDILSVFAELRLLQESVCLVQSHSKFSQVATDTSTYQCAVSVDDCSDVVVQRAVARVKNATTTTVCR
jgi:hypothetical protein